MGGGPRNQRPPLLPGAGAVRFEGATTTSELFHAPPLPSERPGAAARRKAQELREKGVASTRAPQGHFVTTSAAFLSPAAAAVLAKAGRPPTTGPSQTPATAQQDYRPPGTAPRPRATAPYLPDIDEDAAEALLPWRAKNNKPVERFHKTSKFTAKTTASELLPGFAPSERPTRHGAAARHSPRRSVLHDDDGDDRGDDGSERNNAGASVARPPRPATVTSGIGLSPSRRPDVFAPVSPASAAERARQRDDRYVSTAHLLERLANDAITESGGCGHARPPKVPPRPQFRGLGDNGGKPSGWGNDRPMSSSYASVFGVVPQTPERVTRKLRKTPAPAPKLIRDDRDFVTASQMMAMQAASAGSATSPTAAGRMGFASAARAGSAAVASRGARRYAGALATTPAMDDATQTD